MSMFDVKGFSEQGSRDYVNEQATYMLFKELLDEMECEKLRVCTG